MVNYLYLSDVLKTTPDSEVPSDLVETFMDKKEPSDSIGKIKFSQCNSARRKSKTVDRRYSSLPQSSILYPRPHSYVDPQPSLLRRRLMDAQQSYVPSYTGSYRSPCDSSSLYGTSTRRSIYPILPPYGYRDTFYSPRVLPCAHSSPVRRVALSSPVPSHGYPLPSCYEPTLCRQSYYESYLRERLRDFQTSLSRSVEPRVPNENNIKRKVSAAQQTSDRSESEAESSVQNDKDRSRQSVSFTKYYDPCAGRDRLLDRRCQINDSNYEDLSSVDENATEDGTDAEADEFQRIERQDTYRRKFNEDKDEKDINEENTGKVEKVNSHTETATDIDSDKENEEIRTENETDGLIEAIDENANGNEIEKETTEIKDVASDKEQTEETKTDENGEVSEPIVYEPTLETAEDNNYEELVQDITAEIEAQLDTLLEILDTKISDQTTNILSKYIMNTSRGSVIYHMSCCSTEHMVKFIINPQFNRDRCQSLPSIDTSQVIETPPSSSIRTTLAFPSRSWATFCNHTCPKQTTSFSSDAISMYLQHLDISEPQLTTKANNPTPINSTILGDIDHIESEIIRNCLEESTEMFAQDLNICLSSEVQPCTKSVTFTPDS